MSANLRIAAETYRNEEAKVISMTINWQSTLPMIADGHVVDRAFFYVTGRSVKDKR